MTALYSSQGPESGDIFDQVAKALRQTGYIVLNNVFPVTQLQTMLLDIKAIDSAEFHEAGIGRERDHQVNRFVRRDRIFWLPQDHEPAVAYLGWMEQLRLRLNRELFLGLFDYECHYAHYPKGAFYKKHYDVFRGDSNRRLTTILYLNPVWNHDDGGELVMYSGSDDIIEQLLPTFGTMVIFLSEEFPHEVLSANRSRYSLTGWFRINGSSSASLDPPA